MAMHFALSKLRQILLKFLGVETTGHDGPEVLVRAAVRQIHIRNGIRVPVSQRADHDRR
jgi:hypothetical protein